MSLPNIINKYISQKAFQSDTIGKSNAGVCLFEDMVLKIQPISEESENEFQMMKWLKDKIVVHHIIEHTYENECSYLLMSKCDGHMSCAEQYMTNPIKQENCLPGAMHRLWNIPSEGCPCHWPLDKRLVQAVENVESGKVDIADAQPSTFGATDLKAPKNCSNGS